MPIPQSAARYLRETPQNQREQDLVDAAYDATVQRIDALIMDAHLRTPRPGVNSDTLIAQLNLDGDVTDKLYAAGYETVGSLCAVSCWLLMDQSDLDLIEIVYVDLILRANGKTLKQDRRYPPLIDMLVRKQQRRGILDRK